MLIAKQWGQREGGDLSKQGCKVRRTWGHLCSQVAQQAVQTLQHMENGVGPH